MNELALFAGAGGGILGGMLLGWRTVCAVEIDSYCQRVLAERQNDGTLEPFPIYPDVCEFDGREWRGAVDVVSGGFPCQDISSAGKGAGITGERSGLWSEMARIIGGVRPRFVFVENSPALTSRGLGTVLGDLAAMGFDAEWGVLGAHHVGAPHLRARIWIVARDTDRHGESDGSINAEMAELCGMVADAESVYGPRSKSARNRRGRSEAALGNSGCCVGNMDDPHCPQRERGRLSIGAHAEHADSGGAGWWDVEPNVGRVAHGVASRMDRLRAIGNGQVPSVAALAFTILRKRLEEA